MIRQRLAQPQRGESDEPRWDARGSIAIGALLVAIAGILAVEMKDLLIGESATPEDVNKIAAAIAGSADVLGIIHMRSQHLGPDELLVGAKVEFDHGLSVAQLADAIDNAELALRRAVPIATIVYIEPDIRRLEADESEPSAD